MIKLNEVNTKNKYVGAIINRPKNKKQQYAYCRESLLKGDPKAITLIALVITIVVLVILAGVAINLTLGENGIISKAQKSKENYQLSQNEEYEIIGGYEDVLKKHENNSLESISTRIIDKEYNSFTIEVVSNANIIEYEYYIGEEKNISTMTKKNTCVNNVYKYDGLLKDKKYYYYVKIKENEGNIRNTSIFETTTLGEVLIDNYGNQIDLKEGVTISRDNNLGDYYINFDGTDNAYAVINSTFSSNLKWSNGYKIEFEMEWNQFSSYVRILSLKNDNSETNMIGVGNYSSTSSLFASVCDDTSKETAYIQNDFYELNNRIKYSVEYIKNNDGTYKIIAKNITRNLEYILTENAKIEILNVDRKLNYIGFSGSSWDSRLKGKIYNLNVFIDNVEILNMNLNDICNK